MVTELLCSSVEPLRSFLSVVGKVVATLVAAIALLAIGVPPFQDSAAAHEAPPSARFEVLSAYKRTNGSLSGPLDPWLSWDSVNGILIWDKAYTNCSSYYLTEEIYYDARGINADGTAKNAWYNLQGSGSGTFGCPGGTAVGSTVRNHNEIGKYCSACAGAPYLEWRARGATTKTIYALAKTTRQFDPLRPPSNLTIAAVTPSMVTLAWKDESDNEEHFQIERSEDGGWTWNGLRTLSPNSEHYVDEPLSPSGAYRYRVRALNSAGSSAWSNEVATHTPASPGVIIVESEALGSTHSFLSRYFPTQGRIIVDERHDLSHPYVFQELFWEDEARMRSIQQGPNDAYEHEAYFPPGYCWPGPYNRPYWDSNLPAAYLDTDLDDDPQSGYSRAGGSALSAAISARFLYYHYLEVLNACFLDGRSTPVRIKAQDSVRFPSACAAQFEVCVFAEFAPRDIIPYAADLEAPTAAVWKYNTLTNESFENGVAGWQLSGTGQETLDLALEQPYEGASFARLRCGGTPNCALVQVVPQDVNDLDRFTAEVGLRCASSSTCAARFNLRAFGIQAEEVASHVVEATSEWQTFGFVVPTFLQHDHLQFEVMNADGNKGLDIDFTTLHWGDDVA